MAKRAGTVFIGDEVSAAGYRLAGAEAASPDAAATPQVFEDACARAELVLITAGQARHVPPARLKEALDKPRPLVSIVADARGREMPPDLDAEIRAILGLEV